MATTHLARHCVCSAPCYLTSSAVRLLCSASCYLTSSALRLLTHSELDRAMPGDTVAACGGTGGGSGDRDPPRTPQKTNGKSKASDPPPLEKGKHAKKFKVMSQLAFISRCTSQALSAQKALSSISSRRSLGRQLSDQRPSPFISRCTSQAGFHRHSAPAPKDPVSAMNTNP